MRKTLIMLVLAVLLAGYVYFYEIKGGEERQAVKDQMEKLVPLKKDSIDVLDIRGTKGHFHLTKSNGEWWFDTPVKTQADKNTVSGFLSTLTAAKKIRTFNADKKEWAKYGLREPFFNINAWAGTQHDSIRLGDNSGIGSNVFAGKGDSLIYLTAASLKSGVNKSLFDWRDKRVLLFNRAAVNEIRLKNPQGNFNLVLENGKWKLTAPMKTEADESTVNGLLNKLNSGRMKAVENENAQSLKSFKLNKPAYSLSFFEGSNKTEARIILSSVTNSKVFAKDNVRPMVFSLDKDFTKALDKTLFDFRNKKLNDATVTGADRIDWALNGQINSVTKDSSGSWISSARDTLETFKINNLLNAIANLKVTAFFKANSKNLFRFGLKKPIDQITLYKDGKILANLHLGKTVDKKRYILNIQRNLLASVNESTLKNVLKSVEEYKKKK